MRSVLSISNTRNLIKNRKYNIGKWIVLVFFIIIFCLSINSLSESKWTLTNKIYDDNCIIPGSNIIYKADDYAIDMNVVKEILNNTYESDKRMVFLTFDDGPSPNTPKVLDILKEKGVHATFFIKGNMLERYESQEYLKRAIIEGNAIGNHSYSHSLQRVYPSNTLDVGIFMEEYDKTNIILKNLLGEEFDSKVLRIPGGYMSRVVYNDPNLPAFDEELSRRGIVSIDWNSMSGDAEGEGYTVLQLTNNVIQETEGINNAIVLMHDTYGKESTVESLPAIIEYFKENNYEFKVIKST